MNIISGGYLGTLCICRFLLRTDRTSLQNRSASKSGSKHRRAVSVASLNHDDIGIALSEKYREPAPRLKLFSCSTQLSMKFIMLMLKCQKVGILTFISRIITGYESLKQEVLFFQHLRFYEQLKFHAHLSSLEHDFFL